ncbi:hypothetical protein ACWCXH_21290 [Kitasatospora sp. NPDC001660]
MPERNPVGEGGKDERKRIDLSMAQVVASALAAVAGALLASELGVYGTIMGAAVVSVGATTGGAVFQHIFKRTGEQLREAVDRGPNQTANELRQAPADGALPQAPPQAPPVISAEWNEPQMVRARRRWTWKTYAAVSGLVFALAMTPIVAFELATGQPVAATVTGQAGDGTSFGGKVSTDSKRPAGEPASRPSGGGHEPGGAPSGGASAAATSKPRPEPSGSPSGTPASGGSPSADPKPTPDPGSSTTPTSGTSPSPSGGGTPTGGVTPQPPTSGQAPASTAPPAAETPAP